MDTLQLYIYSLIRKNSGGGEITPEQLNEAVEEIEKNRIAVQKMVEELENTIMIPIPEEEIHNLYYKKEENKNE